MRVWMAVCALALVAGQVLAAGDVLKNPVKGTPKISSIDVLGFAPGGVLLIGDGRGGQVLAVVTGDTAQAGKLPAKIENIQEKLGNLLGTDAKGVELIDMAVNPSSGKAYFAVRKQSDKSNAILVLDSSGKLSLFALEGVTYGRMVLPQGDKAPVSKVTDVAWAGNMLVASAQASEEFASKIFAVEGPMENDAQAAGYSAETYHVQHGRWETKAPMSVLIPFEESGTQYVVGAFACTPVVKYAVDSIEPGAKVKGVSVLEIGSGNRPIDMFTYTKEGKSYILSNTFRFHHARSPIGNSPYWTVRFDRSVLAEKDNVNEKALRRLTKDSPEASRVEVIDGYSGVVQMDQLSGDSALVLRLATGDRLDLEVLPLP